MDFIDMRTNVFIIKLVAIFIPCLDRDTFKDILRFMNDNRLYRVKAIIWNINPTTREDEIISRQAHLINLFRPKDIWSNVIIICKKVEELHIEIPG